MTEKRVNPDTGVLEEKHWYGWTPSENAEGREERVNHETESRGRHWHGWTPSEKPRDARSVSIPKRELRRKSTVPACSPAYNAEGRRSASSPNGSQQERHAGLPNVFRSQNAPHPNLAEADCVSRTTGNGGNPETCWISMTDMLGPAAGAIPRRCPPTPKIVL